MSGAPAGRVESVSRVVAYIGRLVAQNKTLAGLLVRGEVSGWARSAAGHVYFDLKEDTDILKCVVWSSNADALPPFKDGDEVIAGGDFGTYAQRSTYQLYVTSLEHTGLGKLYVQFEALKERFRKEGLFAAARKRPMPAFPTRVALVSARAKGAEDFLTTLARRAPQIVVEFVETRMQGEGAEYEIAAAIGAASRMDVDAIVVARGGGSYEDLFPFNLEPVVRAIVESARPVLSAIGHTGDVHLCDLVADRACETPSNAAHYFGAIRDSFVQLLADLAARLDRAVRALATGRAQRYDAAAESLRHVAQRYADGRRQRVLLLERRLDAQTPLLRVARRAERLNRAASRLQAAAQYALAPAARRFATARRDLEQARGRALADARQRFELAAARLAGSDPSAPLERGYAIVVVAGRALRSAAGVAPGETIEARLRRGTLAARVERVTLDD
ncbi:MAG: exodeoxyribonuclease VII large subunit [Vulcanimicrobiaceae bacterium]